jgi:hypothetical protein
MLIFILRTLEMMGYRSGEGGTQMHTVIYACEVHMRIITFFLSHNKWIVVLNAI